MRKKTHAKKIIFCSVSALGPQAVSAEFVELIVSPCTTQNVKVGHQSNERMNV